ncbi:MAG: P-loop NTPase fold protein [Halieaceae bacterium]
MVFPNPDREIRSLSEDLLERGNFVKRLTSALVQEDKAEATGVVLGLNGPWGSGKSSVLNMLDEYIRAEFKSAVVVRFNPWLVSGRNDLIAQFFSELVSAMNAQRSVRQSSYELIDLLTSYGASIGAAADSAFPGLGVLVRGAVAGLEGQISRSLTLSSMRNNVERELSYVSYPIVVLIDELDRVEDDEVRQVARLVKAVAGFPKISYLVAYDFERVAEALGGKGDQKRGEKYLEKIIQFQIDLPVSLGVELVALFSSEINASLSYLELPDNWIGDSRFTKLIDILIPGVVRTARDVKKIVGTYHVVKGLVNKDVDWVDLLAYVVLMTKAPTIISVLREKGDYFASDSTTMRAIEARVGSKRWEKDNYLKLMWADPQDRDPALVHLLEFLFPVLTASRKGRDGVPFPLSTMRALRIVTRLGLPAGEIGRQELEDFLSMTSTEQLARLAKYEVEDSLAAFIDLLDDLYGIVRDDLHVPLWSVLAAFLGHNTPNNVSSYNVRYEFYELLGRLLFRNCTNGCISSSEAILVCKKLLSEDDLSILPYILRSHFFSYGIFGLEQRREDHAFLPENVVIELSYRLVEANHSRLSQGIILPSLWGPQLIFIFHEVNLSSVNLRTTFEKLFLNDIQLTAFTNLLYRENHVTEIEFLEKFVDVQNFLGMLRKLRDEKDKDAEDFGLRSIDHAIRVLTRGY